jgi:thioesterase domain-containing protein/aryl carrier-like protein
VLGALENQNTPFDDIIDELNLRRHFRLWRPFSVNFSFQRGFVKNQEFYDISLVDVPLPSPKALCDLNFSMVRRAEGWCASCEYNVDRYDLGTVEQMIAQYVFILKAVGSNPALRISELTEAAKTTDALDVSFEIDSTAASPPNDSLPILDRIPGQSLAEPETQLEKRLAMVWKDALDVDQIGVEDDFFDLGANSLKAVALLPRISKLVGREVSLITIFANPTIRSLARVLEASDQQTRKSNVAIQALGKRPPFFFLDAEPRLLKLRKFFAPHFTPDQPILSPIADELLAAARPYDLRANAIVHADTIISVQRKGPYYLGGYSAGGVMAFEVAQQLWARNCEVGLLVLFDTPNPYYMGEYSAYQRFLARHEARMTALGTLRIQQILCFLGSRTMTRINSIGVIGRRLAFKLNLISMMREDDPPEDLFWARRRAARFYEPNIYPGRVLLFKSADQFVSGRYREPSYGWGHLIKGGLEIAIVRSDHLDMFDDRIVEPIAVKLRRRLTEIQDFNLKVALSSETSRDARKIHCDTRAGNV